MDVKNLISKIEKNYDNRLYRVGHEAEIDELYKAIQKVLKLRYRIADILKVISELRSHDYELGYNEHRSSESYLNILMDNQVGSESQVGIYEITDFNGYLTERGRGVGVALPYLHSADGALNTPPQSYLAVLNGEGDLLSGNDKDFIDLFDSVLTSIGNKDTISDEVFSLHYRNRYYINMSNVIEYTIAKLNTFEAAVTAVENHITGWINNGLHYNYSNWNEEHSLVLPNANLSDKYLVTER